MHRPLLLLVLAGCASSGNQPPEPIGRQAAIYSSAETGMLLGEKPRAVSSVIAAPPVTVWLAVKKVYTDFEIPLKVENPTEHQIGNPDFFKTRQIGGRAMTEFVDCGSGMTGPKAASYRIYISSLTTVTSDGHGGTTLQTMFIPTGQDMTGNASDRISCGTTGRFEQFFIDRVNAALSKS